MQEKVFSIDWWKVMLQLEEDNNTDGIINEFLQFAVDDLGITKPCKIELTTDKSKTKTYGHYEPSTNTIVIYVKGRGIGDILRTLAHELVHRRQAELDLIKPDSGETGSPIENEANAMAGVLLRKFGEKNPMIYESLIKEEISYPSEEFSVRNKMNLFKKWKLPAGYDEVKIQKLCLSIRDTEMNDEFKNVLSKTYKLNPELKNIKISTNRNYWDLLMGVASRYNLDDIKFFIEDWKYTSKEGKTYFKQIINLESKYKTDISWIPSPKTFNIIKKHFEQLNEEIYGDYLFGDKNSGVKIGWYDSEKEEDTPAEKNLFNTLQKYANSEETTYSQINLDSFLGIFRKLKKEYPEIMEPKLKLDDYIFRGTYVNKEQLNSLINKADSTFNQGVIVSNQEYKSKRQISSWSKSYYNAATFAMSTASRKKGYPIVVRAKAKDAELFFDSSFTDILSGYYESEVFNATNPIKVDIMVIIDEKDEFEDIEKNYLHKLNEIGNSKETYNGNF